MAGLWVIGLLTISLLQWVQALPSPTPLPTTFRHPVTPIRIPALTEALHRRDSSPTTTADVMTTLPASVCGYESAILDDTHRVRCASNYDCVLHMPDSTFRGMAGCCAPSNHAKCAFKTGCYDNIKLRASPDLLSSSDSLMLSCTSSGRLYCLTSTYASMNIVDYNCGNSPSLATVYTWATSFESGVGLVKATKSSETFDGTLLGSSMSRSSGSHASSHVANATSTTSSTPSGSANTGSLNGSGSSISAGTIAGSVVGSLVGVAGIVTAGVVFLLLKKRKQQRVGVVGSGHAQDGYQSGPQDGSPSGWGLHQPVNVDGVPTGKVFEAEGNGPAHKSSDVEGSDPANVAHEMDGSRFIAELPAREEGNPTESR
ncbi:hypothetical protein PENPOL_c010G07823 [Penicillium polonicum]|uniref:Mid2 domain-containing protein n=1 Tax=Penicillium polonicum TaxID=60169 RepID=A0A1V6NFJ6_PENPO|nr:hypothetical protein PENPOL_c010G07823 [Penicillium polonicum]